MLLAILFIPSCSSKETSEVDTAVTANIGWEYADEEIAINNNPISYNLGETIPVMLDGVSCGNLKINWVQKLGIWDYNNKTAVTNGVKESYTININVDMADNVTSGNMLIVSVKPYLLIGGKICGSMCCVGWSGFSETAQIYDGDSNINIEVGLQPEVLDITDAQILLKITDSNGVEYDDVVLANEYLANCSIGPSLVTSGQATVHSINGASFTINIRDVYYEEHETEDESGYVGNPTNFYDFVYDLSYDSGPTNSREVTFFDSSNKFAIPGKLVCYLTSDVDATKLYENSIEARRLEYSNLIDIFPYVTTKFSSVPIGESISASLNRESTCGKAIPTYARICFEFQEELEACTLDEILTFDGRFLVFQELIGERELAYYDIFADTE